MVADLCPSMRCTTLTSAPAAMARLLTTDAKAAGVKLVLIGDWAQLGAIDARGAFHLLATRRSDTPELRTVRRFDETWEAEASTRLRSGDVNPIDAYEHHDGVQGGSRADVLHSLFDTTRDTDDSIVSAVDTGDSHARGLL